MRMTLYLFGKFTQRDAQCIGHPFAVCWIGLQAVANVADLNLPRCPADGAGGVGKEELFLVGGHEAEELAWLGIVIGVFSMIPVVGSALQAERRFGKFRLLLPFPVAVRLVARVLP